MAGGNPTCTPGAGWGGRGGAMPGAAPGIPSAVYGGAYQFGYSLGQAIGKALFGDPQEEARRRAQALSQNRRMLQSLDAMSREQETEESLLFFDAAQRARRMDEEQRQEALSSLKGIPKIQSQPVLRGIQPGDSDLALKPATDFFGTPGAPKPASAPPSDPSVVDLRHIDPTAPAAVDNAVLRPPGGVPGTETRRLAEAECEKRRAARRRLSDGLPVQEEAIRRTELQLAAAAGEAAEASAEAKRVLVEGAVKEAQGYAKDVLTSAGVLRAQVEALKSLNVDGAKRDAIIHALNTAIFEAEGIEQAARAGYESGDLVRARVGKLSAEILPLADKLLIESGIAEAVGEELSGKLGGPLGALGFRGARLSIDLAVAVGKGRIGEAERRAAEANLGTMRSQVRRAKDRIAELDRELALGCAVQEQVRR